MKLFTLALLLPLSVLAQGTAVDRAYCTSLDPAVDRYACVTEQVNARAALKAGELDPDGFIDYYENRFKRCEVFTGADRIECADRVRDGKVYGSVQRGGTLTVLKKIVVGTPE